jgi:hypothetical protein
MDNLSCETIVGEKLVDWIKTNTEAQILSFHPPSSKAYGSDLIRFPKLNSDGSRSRSRNHVDVVFITLSELWLVELKCKYSESSDDVAKLEELKGSYSDVELIKFISNRVTVPLKHDLSKIHKVIIAIGVQKVDTEYNDEVPVFVVDENVQLLGHPVDDLLDSRS